jgi:FkbM family methyltransferase
MGKLGIYEYGHMIHRAWRYRLNTERDEIRFMRSQDLRGKTVLDIGANTGIYSYWMCKQVGKTGRVIGFEPQPEMIEHLGLIKDAFKFKNLTIAETGLSSQIGSATLNRNLNHLGGASLCQNIPGEIDSLLIPLTTLDAYLEENPCGPIAFLKCDVEGHEHEAIAGGMKTLERDRPALLIECHDSQVHTTPLFENLDTLGYDAHFFYKRSLTPISRLDQLRPSIDAPFLNYVFTPKK